MVASGGSKVLGAMGYRCMCAFYAREKGTNVK